MAARKAIDVLRQMDKLDWRTLFVGWRRCWATRADVIDVAVRWLEEHPNEKDYWVAQLAGGESLEEAELEAVLASHVAALSGSLPSDRNSAELDIWRLAHLRLLADSVLDPDAKLARLEELYAEFNYPEDMAACSRYYISPSQQEHGWAVGDQCRSPLDAMEMVLSELSEKLGVVDAPANGTVNLSRDMPE